MKSSKLTIIGLLTLTSACVGTWERQLDNPEVRQVIVDKLLVENDSTRESIIRVLMEDPASRAIIIEELMKDPVSRTAIIEGLMDPNASLDEVIAKLHKTMPISLGHTTVSERLYQEFLSTKYQLDEEGAYLSMNVAILRELLGEDNFNALMNSADSCSRQPRKGFPYCKETLPAKLEAQIPKSARSFYKMVHFGEGVTVHGSVSIHLYLSPYQGEEDNFYIEGEGVFFAEFRNFDQPIATGMFYVVPNGPYSISQLDVSDPYLDVGIRAQATTFYPPAKERPDAWTNEPKGKHVQLDTPNVQYRIRLKKAGSLISINQTEGHVVGMVLDKQTNTMTPVGCAQFVPRVDDYSVIDFSGGDFIRRLAPSSNVKAVVSATPWGVPDAALGTFCKGFPASPPGGSSQP